MTSKLDQLKKMTDVVADTGDIEVIKKYTPLDATTNPSLLLKAASLDHYKSLISDAITFAQKTGGSSKDMLSNACDRFAVLIGLEILNIVPGRVSTS